MQIADMMTTPVTSARATDTLRRALEILADLEIRHLPVVDDAGILLGMITDRDLREFQASPTVGPRDPLDAPLAAVMRAEVISVDADEPVTTAIDLMIDTRVGALPVLDPRTRALVGIVSYVDLLRFARDLLVEDA